MTWSVVLTFLKIHGQPVQQACCVEYALMLKGDRDSTLVIALSLDFG